MSAKCHKQTFCRRALLILLMGAPSEDGDRAFAVDVEFAERFANEG